MVYYSINEYILSIVIASIAAFIGITFIRKLAFIEESKVKIFYSSFIFGAIIYISFLYTNFSQIDSNINFLWGTGLFLFSSFAVNTALNSICLKHISFSKLILGSVIFSLCISSVNMVDIWSEMVSKSLKMNLLLFISGNILLIGNSIATIRFIRQLRDVEKVNIYWPIIGSFAIGMAFASVRFTLFSSITLFSEIDLFMNQNISILDAVYLNSTLLPLMINIISLVFLELVPGLFSDSYSNKQKELIIENKNRYETLFDNQAIAIFSLNPQGKVVKINNTVYKMTGFQLEQLKELPSFNNLIASPNSEEFATYLQEATVGHSQMIETKLATSSKKYISVQITLIPNFVKGHLTNINVLAKDITEVIRIREEMQYMAYHDALTGLPNRRHFIEELHHRIGLNSSKIAVCFLDLDRFKVINDILGHKTGDDLLKTISERFLTFVNEGVFVARMGGDEFIFLFPNVTSNSHLERKIQELLLQIQAPFLLEDQELYVTGSVGISLYPDDSQLADDLIKFADAAMYRAKQKGKNTHEFYHNQLNKEYLKNTVFEKDIRKAIKEQQFEVYYQPQVKMSTGKVFNMEALVRWNHPEEGFIGPDEFISIAEENGVIHELGEWVLSRACKEVKRWQEEGFGDLKLSVNVSFKQFYHQNFIDIVKSILENTGFNPRLLDLEITESMAMKDIEYAKLIFEQLRNLGISISIDDFGTGYSSLNHIKSFPIDRVKIDGSIVRDVPHNKKATIILKTIIGMAKNLDLLTLAEQVETDEQYNFLKKIDCDEIQGYHYSPPLNRKEMGELLRKEVNVMWKKAR